MMHRALWAYVCVSVGTCARGRVRAGVPVCVVSLVGGTPSEDSSVSALPYTLPPALWEACMGHRTLHHISSLSSKLKWWEGLSTRVALCTEVPSPAAQLQFEEVRVIGQPLKQ